MTSLSRALTPFGSSICQFIPKSVRSIVVSSVEPDLLTDGAEDRAGQRDGQLRAAELELALDRDRRRRRGAIEVDSNETRGNCSSSKKSGESRWPCEVLVVAR